MEIKEISFNLKEGHAVCFDFDGVIHKYYIFEILGKTIDFLIL